MEDPDHNALYSDADMDVSMLNAETSLVGYLASEKQRANEALLRDKIPVKDYVHYFNYGITPMTWNLLVNK